MSRPQLGWALRPAHRFSLAILFLASFLAMLPYQSFAIKPAFLGDDAPQSQQNDCPDRYWDCLLDDTDGLRLARTTDSPKPLSTNPIRFPVPTGGGLIYGTCMNWSRLACLPCRPRDETDVAWIVGRCNQEVLECKGRCSLYADISKCCSRNERCGNLPEDPEVKEILCGGGAASSR